MDTLIGVSNIQSCFDMQNFLSESSNCTLGWIAPVLGQIISLLYPTIYCCRAPDIAAVGTNLTSLILKRWLVETSTQQLSDTLCVMLESRVKERFLVSI